MMKTNKTNPLVSAWSAIADWRGTVRRGRPLRLSRHVTSTLKLLLLVVAATWSGKAMAGIENKLPETSTSNAPKYYVIMNCETNKYMKYNGHSGTSYMKLDATVVDASLWYFEGTSVESGCKIVTKAGAADGNSYKYLTDGEYSLNRIGKYSADGSTFYIHQNPADMVGCVVSTTAGTPVSGMAKCMEEYGSDEVALNDLGGGEDFKWIFKSYDDLLAEAQANGVNTSSYENLDKTDAANFNSLITAIKNAHGAATLSSGTKYLLRNRRYGYYLNSNGTGLAAAATPTEFSEWTYTTVGSSSYLVSHGGVEIKVNTSASNYEYYSLESAGTPYVATAIASSDGDKRYVAFQETTITSGIFNTEHYYYMAMESDKVIKGREGQSFSSDWEFIEATDATRDLTISSDEDLVNANTFFRIRNVARDVQNYAADAQFDGGGWLEDVDHTHFIIRKDEATEDDVTVQIEQGPANPRAWLNPKAEAELFYTARKPEFYAAVPDMRHASALWQFELVSRGQTELEHATGLIASQHSTFRIKNANTGYYIKKPESNASNGTYLDKTQSASQAAVFYLEKLIDGQYGLMLYNGTTGGSDTNNGAVAITGTDEGYHAGMTKQGSATVNTNSAWIIMPATTLELEFLNLNLVKDPDRDNNNADYDWSTMYFRYIDAELNNANDVQFYSGEWGQLPVDGQQVGTIDMTAVSNVPAGNAVIVNRAIDTNNPNRSNIVLLNVYPKGHFSSTTFSGNVWKGIVESDEKSDAWLTWSNETYTENTNWHNYWVLTQNHDGYLRLLHPAGHYLLPNRAYLDQESASSARMDGFTSFRLDFGSDTNGISEIRNNETDNVVYDLQGRRVNRPQHGLYIVNGKKILVK